MSENIISITPNESAFSGHLLMIISKIPHYTPSENQIQNTLEVLVREYPNCEITSEIYDSIEFIDQGQNFEKVSCNKCKEVLSIEFWQERMDESYENSHFKNLDFTTLCCNERTNLNDLIYEGDCGFGSYSIMIINAGHDKQKEERLTKLLSATLNTDIKLFWKHI